MDQLPNEILRNIFDCLPKSDLKAVRLVSKHWQSMTIERLFDTCVVSPHVENIGIFITIFRHPIYKNYVRRLIYDGTYFGDMRKSEFRNRLQDQIIHHRVPGVQLPLTDAFVDRAFLFHEAQVRSQRIMMWDRVHGVFTEALNTGLKSLPRLKQIQIWSECHVGAPRIGLLQRSWDFRFLRTSNKHTGTSLSSFRYQYPFMKTSFFILDRLMATEKQGLYFKSCRIHPMRISELLVFRQENIQSSTIAFQAMHGLDWLMDNWRLPAEQLDRSVAAFSSLLQAAGQLRELRLEFSRELHPEFRPHAVHFGILFAAQTWTRLTVLGLNRLTATGSELVAFLLRHAGSLKKLTLRNIYLRVGLWKEVFDQTREYLALKHCFVSGLGELVNGVVQDYSKTCGEDPYGGART